MWIVIFPTYSVVLSVMAVQTMRWASVEGLFQILAIIIVIALVSGHHPPRYDPNLRDILPSKARRGDCESMSALNIVWLAKLMVQCYVDGWFLLHRWQE